MESIQKKIMGNICQSFIYRSIGTWFRLKSSIETGISISEDSITDFNLLDLQTEHPFEIKTQRFNSTKEGENGADWEWWLGSNDNWLGFRIQAKKIDVQTLNYKELDHKNKKGKQIDLLIEDSFDNDPLLIPLYVFYNYWDNKFVPTWECKINSKCVDISDHEPLFGCGLSYAIDVKEVLENKSKKIDDILEITYPWSCLVCCPQFSKDSMDLPTRAFNFIKNSFNDTFMWENFPKERFIKGQAPFYVDKIRKGIILSEEDWDQLEVNKITVIYQEK